MRFVENTVRISFRSALIAGIVLFGSTFAYAEPIKLGGLDMTMSLQQQQAYLKKAGFECDQKQYPWGVKYVLCKSGKREIRPSKNNVRFNCSTFKVCKHTLRELAQELVGSGFVPQMEYKPKYVTDFDGNKVLIEKFCGRGVEGENLCVEADKNPFGKVLLTVILEKGRLGQGSVNFD